MRRRNVMIIAGEVSGDTLAAELVPALRNELTRRANPRLSDYQPLRSSLLPRFFGAGGTRMRATGVELAFDLTQHAVVGISDVVRNYFKFRRLFGQLYQLALEQQPDAIICVDFGGFNRRFAHAIQRHIRSHQGWFHPWRPKVIQYVSPQVWASREGRARQIAKDYDLLVSILPFEKEWYARVPELKVEFVGHPIVERHRAELAAGANAAADRKHSEPGSKQAPLVLLLPGSRSSELSRHLPVMLEALALMRAALPNLRGRMVLPNAVLLQQARAGGLPGELDVRVGDLAPSLSEADVSIASTGTVTLECALYGLPTVALYKTSWSTFQIGKRLVKVPYLSMPNLMAKEAVFPEFIQDDATAENLSSAAMELLRNEQRRVEVKTKLADVVRSLGAPGAATRAAGAIADLLEGPPAVSL